MKRAPVVLTVLAMLTWAGVASAHEGHHMAGEKITTKSVKGEVVDMGCWLGHAARGEKHASCAAQCLGKGMAMGLLTSNGTLYLVTLDHDNADPYNRLKGMAGKEVTITGEILARSGMKAIEASNVQLASK